MDMNQEKELEVWRRVYNSPRPPARLTPRQRQQLRQALSRCMENLRVFEGMSRDPYYGEAFEHMASQTTEHTKMLRQMLGL